jgi:hypothetical protein
VRLGRSTGRLLMVILGNERSFVGVDMVVIIGL